jgi:hypothetical protein
MSNPISHEPGHGLQFGSYDEAERLCPWLDLDDADHWHRPVKLGACWYIRMSERESGIGCGEV